MIIDSDLCEHNNRVNGFSMVINNDLTRLDKIDAAGRVAIFSTGVQGARGPRCAGAARSGPPDAV